MENIVRFTFIVGDTTRQFAISIERAHRIGDANYNISCNATSTFYFTF